MGCGAATAGNPDPIIDPTWQDETVIDWDSSTSGSGTSTVVPWQEDLGIGPAGVDAWQATWVGPDLQDVLDDEAAGLLPDDPVGVVVWLRDDSASSCAACSPIVNLPSPTWATTPSSAFPRGTPAACGACATFRAEGT